MKKLLLLFLIPLVLAAAEAPATAPEPLSAPAENVEKETEQKTYYTPEEVSEAGSGVVEELEEINASLQPSKEMAQIEASLPAYIESLESMRKEVDSKRLETLSIKELTRAYEQAAVYRDELERYREMFDKRVELHTRTLERLKALESLWISTLQYAVAENAPRAIEQRIKETLVRIATMRESVKRSFDRVLTYQDMVVAENQKIRRSMEKIATAKEELSTRLFVRDSEPLTQMIAEGEFRWKAYAATLWQTIRSMPNTFYLFYTGDMDRLYIHFFLILFFGGLIFYLRYRDRKGELFVLRDEKVRGSVIFVHNPLAATVVLAVLLVGAVYPERPAAVVVMNVIVAMAALIVIIRKLVDKKVLPYVYIIMGLYVVGALQDLIIGFEPETRLIWFLISVILFAVIFQVVRRGDYSHWEALGRWRAIVSKFLPAVLLLLAVSIFGNLGGMYNLSHRLVLATLVSLILFVGFTVISMVFGGLIVMVVRRRALESSRLIDSYAAQIERQLKFIVNLFLIVYWFYLVLHSFGVIYLIEDAFGEFLALQWDIGNLHFSMAAIFNFFFVLTVTVFLTRFIRIFLDLEVFSRYRFPRGVPTAIQMITRYTVITIGVIVALHALGIELSDLSLLAGALGVGIGFGLRNIMANFISGIIMVFERPVQEGDVVQVDQTFGDVLKIGVRATTIKTYDGSEVIVPNADFVTKEVINWTLSSKHRRVKMAYKVAFGNNPKEVIDIIRRVIESHPDVKEDPEPKVLFEGYGDYFLEFTVYFWVDERLLDVKSETAIAIYEALNEAGVKMPVPLSNVRYEGPPPA